MRTIVALLFISAALSASATNPVLAFVEGVAAGLNNTVVVGDVNAFEGSAETLKIDLQYVVEAAETRNLLNVTEALEVVIQDLYTVVVHVHDLISDVDAVVEEFVGHAENLTKNVAINNLLLNYNQSKVDIETIVDGAKADDYYTVGTSAAELLKIALFGQPSVPFYKSRAVRQLTEVNSVLTDALDVILLLQGFFETANTTVNPTEFETCINDVTYAAVLVQPVVNDLKAKNYSAAIADGKVALQQLQVVRGDTAVLNGQIAQWIARDLPLIEDHNRVVTAIEAVFTNSQATSQNVQNIEAAYKNGDFEGTGKAIGNLYNEFYAVLSQ